MMDPGHLEHNLWGVVSLAMPDMPEAWQHAVNHWLDGALAFSGLSLGLGYGVLALVLPLLLLPTAFPELSRPRDALWSLLLAALAPLLLMNRLPVLSSAGFGELIATVLMARLAAEVGQGRWESLTPDQKEALRHLPRWRRAGADVVAAVVQAAKAAWSATVQAGKAVQGGDQDGGTSSGVPDMPPAMEASSGPAADNAPDQEDAATGGSGAAPLEQEHRAGTGLVVAVVQAGKAAWGAVSGQKGPVEERQQRRSAQKPARKEWVRPDPSDGAQGDQDGGTSPGILDMAPATGASPDPAATSSGEDATPEQEHPGKPTVDGPGMAVVVDDTPEEPSAPEAVEEPQVEEPQQAQPVDGDDLGDGNKGADAVPEVGPVEPPELGAQPSEGVVADAVGPEPEPRESAPEEPSIPEPVKEAQPPGGTDHPKASQVDAGFQDVDNGAPVDVALEDDPGDVPGDVAAAGEGGEGVVTAEAAAGGPQEATDTPGAETEPAQSTGDGPTQPDQDGKDLVVSSFDEVDGKLRGDT